MTIQIDQVLLSFAYTKHLFFLPLFVIIIIIIIIII